MCVYFFLSVLTDDLHPALSPSFFPSFVRPTKEFRESLTKLAAASTEKAKTIIRKLRQDGMKELKKDLKAGMSEDENYTLEKKVKTNIRQNWGFFTGGKVIACSDKPSFFFLPFSAPLCNDRRRRYTTNTSRTRRRG